MFLDGLPSPLFTVHAMSKHANAHSAPGPALTTGNTSEEGSLHPPHKGAHSQRAAGQRAARGRSEMSEMHWDIPAQTQKLRHRGRKLRPASLTFRSTPRTPKRKLKVFWKTRNWINCSYILSSNAYFSLPVNKINTKTVLLGNNERKHSFSLAGAHVDYFPISFTSHHSP